MLLVFLLGVLLIMLCALNVLRRHRSQRCAVLLVACALPAARLEQALYTFAQRCASDCRHWYVYICSEQAAVSWQMLGLLAQRWGFSLLSGGECQRLQHSKNYQFYFFNASGVLYLLPAEADGNLRRLFTI